MPRFHFGRRESNSRDTGAGEPTSASSTAGQSSSARLSQPRTTRPSPAESTPPPQPPPSTSQPHNPEMASLADGLKIRGNSAFRDGDYRKAEDLYTQAINKYSKNPLLFTNRANARLKLQKWADAMDDCLRSIDLTGPNGHNHKANHFLAQAQLALGQPNEALESALTAYNQVLHPSPTAKTSPSDLHILSTFVLKCKKARFTERDLARQTRTASLLAQLETLLTTAHETHLRDLAASHPDKPNLLASLTSTANATHDLDLGTLRSIFAIADPSNHTPKEVPDHLVDMITFEPMHDPVITKTGHSYERATIMEHLKHSPTDPLTREPLRVEELRSNFGLKAACEAFWDSGAREWIGDW